MGKLFNTMVLGTMTTLALLLLDSTGTTPTSLFLMMLNPVNYENNAFYLIFGIGGLATITGGIIIGVAAIIRQDWLMRAGFITSLSSLTIFPFIDLFRFIVAKTNYISLNCSISPVCLQLNSIQGIGQILGLIFVGPIILYAFWSNLEYVWKGDSF